MTPIEWIVLEVREDRALLLSRCALDCRPYHDEYTRVTWEACGLREWLNGAFLDRAFAPEELRRVLTVTVDNSRAQGSVKWNTVGGSDTQDRVFLLSYQEAVRYFSSNNARRCAPTDWAAANGAYADNDYKADGRPAGWWWLRSPGSYYSNAAAISRIGGLGADINVNSQNAGVRPAVWIDLTDGGR